MLNKLITAFIYCFYILSFLVVNTQDYKKEQNIIENGTIIFEKTTKITNQEKFEASLKKMQANMVNSIEKSILEEFSRDSLEVDTIRLNLALLKSNNFHNLYLKTDIQTSKTFIYKFQDSIIIAFEKINNEIIGDYKVINRGSSQVRMLAKKDSTTFYGNKRLYSYSRDKIISIKEYRNDVKNIYGYNCFKVVFKSVERNEDMDSTYQELFESSEKTYECYMTENIRSDFHPILKFKSILDKYYPLEIKELNTHLKGIEINYQLTDSIK